MQSQVRFNRVPEKVLEKVWEALVLRCFQRLALQHASERFVKIKRCGCWGYHRSLLYYINIERCHRQTKKTHLVRTFDRTLEGSCHKMFWKILQDTVYDIFNRLEGQLL